MSSARNTGSDTEEISLGNEKESDVEISLGGTNELQLLEDVIQHFLIDHHPHSTPYLIGRNAMLAIASVSSAWMYLEPSLAYGRRFHDKTEMILQGVNNLISAALVTLNVAQMYIHYLEDQYALKRALARYLQKVNQFQAFIKEAIIISGSILSAAPLTAASVQYSTGLPLWENILKNTLITFDYSLIHTLPMSLLVNTPLRYVFGLPFYVLYHVAYALPRHCLSTEEDLYQSALQEQTYQDQQSLKMAMVQTLTEATQRLIDAALIFDPRQLDYISSTDEQVLKVLKTFRKAEQDTTDNHAITKYVELLEGSLLLPTKETRTLPDCFNNYLNPALGWLSWGVGVLSQPASISGFIMSTYNQTLLLTGSVAAAYGFSSLPSIVTAVLVGYFGGKVLEGVYNTAVGMARNDVNVPLAMRLYPRATAVLIGLSAFVSYYSSGPAEELVYTNFTDPKWDGIREILVGFARYGIQMYTFINMFEIIQSGLHAFAKKVGGDDQFLVELFSERIEAMKMAIYELDGQQLENNLKQLTKPQRRTLLGMKENKFDALINHKANVKAYAYKGTVFNTYCGCIPAKEEQPLLEHRQTATYSSKG